MPTSGDLAPGNVGMRWSAVNRFSTSPSLEHLFHHLDILPVLWPSGRFFRPNDVFEARGEELMPVHFESYGLRGKIGEAGRSRRLKREIQPPRLGRQVPGVCAREHLRAAIERQPFGYLLGVDTRIELAQRRGQPLQVR